MESDRPKKRQSLLPTRSASHTTSNNNSEEEHTNLQPPSSSAKHRDISPSKLPVGGLRRGQPSRQSGTHVRTTSSKTASHKSQPSTSTLLREGHAAATPARTPSSAAATQSSALRKPSTINKTPATGHSKQPSQGLSRPPTSHKISASVSEGKPTLSVRPPSSGKDVQSAGQAQAKLANAVPPKPLANVKIQRPAAASHQQRPASPRKATRGASAPSINKFALLTTPPSSAQKPVQDAKVELLHLHMLHREAHSVKAQWTASAKSHYEKHFNRLIQLEDEQRASEIDLLEQQNAAALIEWCKEVSIASGESKTRVLSNVLNDMWLLVSPGGRYTASVAAFEDWHGIAEESLEHRIHETNINVMEGLGDGWKAEVDTLMSLLCKMSDDMEHLGPAAEPSDLSRCINVLMTLLANMLEELVLIRDIEQKFVARENSWVKGRVEGLSAKVSGDH